MPGHEIARGRACIVYDLGDGTVLRRAMAPGIDVEHEARVMTHARRHGVAVPAVHRAAGTDLVLDLVAGPTMLEDLIAHPEHLARNAQILAQLHASLDGVGAPPDAAGAATAGSLLHLDLHPGNVILSPDGPVLIDWTNARGGERATDVAMTWLIIETLRAPDGLAHVVEPARAALAEAFLSHVDAEVARAGLPRARALRRADPATSRDELRRIDELLVHAGITSLPRDPDFA